MYPPDPGGLRRHHRLRPRDSDVRRYAVPGVRSSINPRFARDGVPQRILKHIPTAPQTKGSMPKRSVALEAMSSGVARRHASPPILGGNL